VLLNTAVAEAISEITAELRNELRDGKHDQKMVDDAALKVVRRAFKESASVRFEGNNYSDEWVVEAERRGLPNLRRTPEALKQLVTPQSRTLLTSLGIFTDVELDSRYHVRLERYTKDMLIELHTLMELVDTCVVPAALRYTGALTASAAQAKTAGISIVPQAGIVNRIGAVIEELLNRREKLGTIVSEAESMHADPHAQAQLLTSDAADTMQAVREKCDELELMVSDEEWPLPKYREILFPV
jgi:glutamine synthetase